MKKTVRSLTAFGAAVLMLLTMCACDDAASPFTDTAATTAPSAVATAPTGSSASEAVPTAPSSITTQTTVPTAPTTPEETVNRNIITGLDDMGDSTLSRPVGIMIANNDYIQDEQVGLASADMWVEIETEGGITRMMAVFANTERVPDSIGPVRSARSPFFHVVEALGLAYVHAGGSYPALNKIAASNIADLDVNIGDSGKYSWRDNSLGQAYEYRLRTGGEELTQYMADQGYKSYAVCDFPWTFGAQSGAAATDIDIRMSGAQKIGFEYDTTSGVYYKTNGSYETPHTDTSGLPITAENVIVLYSDQFMETDITIDFYLSYGEGYVFSDGVMRRFDWSRGADGFTMTEKDGSKLTLSEGKVYMCVVSTSYADSISYR